MAANPTPRRALSHIEFVYRPGERELAVLLFKSLGLEVAQPQGYLLGFIESTDPNPVENMITASEITPEHWRFEQALTDVVRQPELSELGSAYRQALKRHPQNRPHFGISYPSMDQWQATVDSVQRAIKEHPELRGRVELANVFRPGDPGAETDYLHHAFIHTDIIATSCLALGLIIELQYYAQNAPVSGS